jgi:Xaa-Pro dipeptidase
MPLNALFRQHIALRQKTTEQALRDCRLDGVVIGAGGPSCYPEDDMTVPFRSYHHFTHWCPAAGDGHLLHIRPGQKPRLYVHAPKDYWHETTELGDAFWTSEFQVESRPSSEAAWAAVQGQANTAYLGPDGARAQAAGLKTEVAGLLPRLNWERSFKSDYEVTCAERATRRSAKGHAAAREAFLAGGSELEIHNAYMRAIRGTEDALPYGTIVALNEKGAVLHYQKKRDKTRQGKTFLIDAGARYKGYAADITRTHAADEAPPEFRALLGAMNKLQQRLCARVLPGLSFEHLHGQAHLEIGGLLLEHGILKGASREAAVELGLTAVFFPHGLGHMLGIFTHDVGGKQADRIGTPTAVNPKYKVLRTNRILDAGNLLTIEPGIYFIEMLLAPERQGPHRDFYDWGTIDRLMPCGGIRIEDDVLVTRSGLRNITREFLP